MNVAMARMVELFRRASNAGMVDSFEKSDDPAASNALPAGLKRNAGAPEEMSDHVMEGLKKNWVF